MIGPRRLPLTQLGEAIELVGALPPHELLAQSEKSFSRNTLKTRMYRRDHVSTHYLEKPASKEKTAIRQQPSPVACSAGTDASLSGCR
jgi:hypothetical protein